MFSFFKSKKVPLEKTNVQLEEIALEKKLSKTRSKFSDGLLNFVLGKKEIDDDLIDDLQDLLIMADVGIQVSTKVIDHLNDQISRKHINDPSVLIDHLKSKLLAILKPVAIPLEQTTQNSPYVILVLGVNGAGKTTSIGKLAKQLKDQGKTVMLAAGDTFRAAAVEQLQEWGVRNDIPVIAQPTGSDSASVVFDAYESAKAKKIDILIADTSGRLHTNDALMSELKKIKRVLTKGDETAPHETLLVIDGGMGQNALSQAVEFNKAMDLTGIAITKLDGTAKGGILFAIAEKLELPIRFIGVGEGIDDLIPLNAKDYVDAVLSTYNTN
jgi:fused signal recognition particle receptor